MLWENTWTRVRAHAHTQVGKGGNTHTLNVQFEWLNEDRKLRYLSLAHFEHTLQMYLETATAQLLCTMLKCKIWSHCYWDLTLWHSYLFLKTRLQSRLSICRSNSVLLCWKSSAFVTGQYHQFLMRRGSEQVHWEGSGLDTCIQPKLGTNTMYYSSANSPSAHFSVHSCFQHSQ